MNNLNCWGDSHCSTFDNLRYDFTQTCFYDFVSTQCYNSSLPSNLVGFDVKFDYGKRESLRPNQVSFIRNIFIQVYGMKFLLFISRSGMPTFTLNGIQMTNNYFDEKNGIKIFYSVNNFVFSAEFGLTVKWDGVHKAEIMLCDYYSNFVCGLCGNADGVTSNDKRDRKNNFVAQSDQWEIEWKTINDKNNKNIFDNCHSNLNQKNREEILCENKLKYENVCSLIKNSEAPWKECVQKLSNELVEALFDSCVMDLCSLEGDPNQQAYKCYAFEELTSKCYETENSTFINWRSQANCEIECNLNQEFRWDSSLACPENCFYLYEEYDCGIREKQEGCYCKNGFILDSMGNCIKPESCGCRLPENYGMLESSPNQIGKTFKTPNCLNEYLCVQPYGNVIVIGHFDGCGMNAQCIGDINNEPTCVCHNGYLGDGHFCYMENNELNNFAQLEDVSFSQTFCENSTMWLQCPADQMISIENAEFGRSDFLKCQSINMTLDLCNPLNVRNLVEEYCNGKRNCKMEVTAEKIGNVCPNVDKYLQIKYRCVLRPSLPNPCLGNPCGFGAFCRNVNGFPECSCPTGTSGDAKVRCCKILTCGCWGDPHCTTFDYARFDFMGKCKYELVTTKCFNQILCSIFIILT
ncbi:c-binding -like [Brachionus plicatilis]|uniref:C-binding-like n=1 Tax=Brachionus plicatilis TaxID=10195 RepID=A0A3M7PGD0_BRAPC|nr:c-binding -like [Brachionus plicatilis]